MLRNLLQSPHLEFLMEAHNGLSARIVEEAGFKGIWASSLAISASMGVRDNNELSWSQVVDIVEHMTDACDIPILLDADTGYGNFNNVRRLVRKLEQRGIAGLCIEDKTFPKTNSYIRSESQLLAGKEEFCGKIQAAKDVQVDPDFCVIARTEAFVTGHPLEAALERAHAYYAAGADAILVHSKEPTADQVLLFMRNWPEPCPVVIVPTSYSSTPTRLFENAGISVVIWANHILRSSIFAMQRTAQRIFAERSIHRADSSIASVEEVFRLQRVGELNEAENRYLPRRESLAN